jgi:DNA repair exonuclease SbcCD ATPase subunit
MGYRDELQAAQARARQLEQELERAREELERAQRPKPEKGEPKHPVPAVRDRIRQYGEKLAAAEERIAGLAEELAGAEARSASAVASAVARRAEEHEREVGRLRAALAEAERRLGGPIEKAHTIVEHNRKFGPIEDGTKTDVICPLCSLAGEKVHMVRARGWRLPMDDPPGRVTAVCPRCRHLHMMLVEER